MSDASARLIASRRAPATVRHAESRAAPHATPSSTSTPRRYRPSSTAPSAPPTLAPVAIRIAHRATPVPHPTRVLALVPISSVVVVGAPARSLPPDELADVPFAAAHEELALALHLATPPLAHVVARSVRKHHNTLAVRFAPHVALPLADRLTRWRGACKPDLDGALNGGARLGAPPRPWARPPSAGCTGAGSGRRPGVPASRRQARREPSERLGVKTGYRPPSRRGRRRRPAATHSAGPHARANGRPPPPLPEPRPPPRAAPPPRRAPRPPASGARTLRAAPVRAPTRFAANRVPTP
eukprot:scaffold32375_cov107-Isochrysis_galbana.AAC.2